MGVDPFQAEVARVALVAAADHGFALAGGNALVVHGLVDRPTQDVDLFSPEPGAPGVVLDSVRRTLETAGYRVEVTRRPEDSAGEFAQLAVSRNEESMLLDLARDWRQLPPVSLDIGPVLHLDDAVGSKVTAMVGRGLPRDFIDVAAALARYSREELMMLAFVRDPGLPVRDFSDAARALDEIPADAFAAYGMDGAAIATMRARFDDWPRDVASDIAGHRTHKAAHRPSRSTGLGPLNPPTSWPATSPSSVASDDHRPQPPSL